MNRFRRDNTEGFSDRELAAMNDEYNRAIAEAVGDLPDGAEGATDDQIDRIKRSVSVSVLRQFRRAA